ncbi:hypothetical protein SKTS_22660 [Sulfurimicrobium lacus]|uniref:Thioredoxin domain-containing protein n=1 Tax=Sulfurimicrobium lacus TaxID=2715678 RepID=A0A6F8VDG2_9PROT|nr:thioredoxin family protein [Sulfurimicrobium lacus]BCB27380.1 hypothetical protein SKTS_22660 [Sulfurimicrobium lacus]
MTTYFGIALTAILLALALLQWRMARKAKKMEGQAVPEIEPEIEQKLRERGRALLYFYSPNCAPCRAMTPRIDQAATRHDNVFKFDVAQSLEIARKLGVMGTPTTLLIADGRIAQVNLGILSEKRLEELLA